MGQQIKGDHNPEENLKGKPWEDTQSIPSGEHLNLECFAMNDQQLSLCLHPNQERLGSD